MDKHKFAEHLKTFIVNKESDTQQQEKILSIASSQFDINKINKISKKCKKCYGRGFVGYNIIYNHFEICSRCLT
jgi:hypothetical protein